MIDMDFVRKCLNSAVEVFLLVSAVGIGGSILLFSCVAAVRLAVRIT